MNYILQSLALILVNAVFACILHEAAHVAVASLFRIKVKNIGVSWLGFYTVREEAPPFDNMIVALAGPLANLVFAALLFLPQIKGEAWNLFLANLIVGGFNLLPFEKSDGTRAAECWRKIERAPEEIRNEQIMYGARGTGKTDAAAEIMFIQAEKFLRTNPRCVYQVWVISHKAAEAMYQRFKLAGFDMSRIYISVSGEQHNAKAKRDLSSVHVALHNQTSQRSAGDD
jgi:hypothetical protein